jgi:hypothetical protein
MDMNANPVPLSDDTDMQDGEEIKKKMSEEGVEIDGDIIEPKDEVEEEDEEEDEVAEAEEII